jgi:class 3 adenylate cyclase
MQRAMPASLRDQLLTDSDGENRLLTILFADLTGSVRNTRDLAPEDAATQVNDVLKAMVDAVLEYDGCSRAHRPGCSRDCAWSIRHTGHCASQC